MGVATNSQATNAGNQLLGSKKQSMRNRTDAHVKRTSYKHREYVLPEIYFRLAGLTQTENQLRGLQILFDEKQTPEERELFIEKEEVVSSYLEPVQAALTSQWISSLKASRRISHTENGLRYQREISQKGVKLYRFGPHPSRRLVVGFGGAAKRLMMPAADFLSFLGAHESDLLLFTPPRPYLYDNGIPGFGRSFREGLVTLRSFISDRKYKRIDVIGTSAGAVPALVSGRSLGARTIGLVGPPNIGEISNQARFADLHGFPLLNQPEGRRARRSSDSLITATVGQLREKDVQALEPLERHFSCECVVVPGAPHGALWPLAKAGAFPAWLDFVFSPGSRERGRLDAALVEMRIVVS
jgi:hypothetical protein